MRAQCKIEGCDKESRGRGWCATHWARWRKHGDPLYVKVSGVDYNVKGTCAVTNCGEPVQARAMCRKHYTRLMKHGDADALGRMGRPLTGEHPTFTAVHKRLERQRGSASKYACVDCDRQAQEWSYNNTDPSELREAGVAYSTNLDSYSPRCISCHRKFDRAADKRRRNSNGQFAAGADECRPGVRIVIRRAA